MIYGYARGGNPIFTDEMVENQVTELKNAGVDKIIINRYIDANEANDKFRLLLSSLDSQSTLICTSIQYICENVLDLLEMIEIIRTRSLRLQILPLITIDCRNEQYDEATNAYINLCNIINDLTVRMIEAKGLPRSFKHRKGKIGRPHTRKEDIPTIFLKYYPIYLAGNLSISAFARICHLSRPTVYKYIRLMAE